MLISVVIPTFNRRALVTEAIQSVCSQTEASFEVIVVDDGSTDSTSAWLDATFGARIRLIRSSHRGVSAARNVGVAHARGELIAFLDSDDLWLPGKLDAQARFFLETPEAEICQTEEIWIRNGTRVNPCKHHRKLAGDIFHASLQRCLVSPSAVMLRRASFERLGGFDESLPACEDYDLWLRFACTVQVHLIDEALVVKRGGHADQLSRRYWGMDRFRIASLLRLLANPALSSDQYAAVVGTICRKIAVLAEGAEKRGRGDEAARYRALGDWALAQTNATALDPRCRSVAA